MTKSSKSKDKKPAKGVSYGPGIDTKKYEVPTEPEPEATPIPESKPEVPDGGSLPPEPKQFDPAPGLPRIHLRIFERVAGPKWDQLAGFKHYAKAQKLGPMSIPEWHDALQAFKHMPTK